MTYLASLEVCYQCYKIIGHLISCSFLNCFCDRYDGCLRSEYASKDYCIVCRTYASYDLEKLKDIKRNSFKLEKFYLNMLRDLAEIKIIDSATVFWNDKALYKYKNWSEGTESQTCLRNVIAYFFNK